MYGLEEKVHQFHNWLKEYALPGFVEKTKDTYTEEYDVLFNELSWLGEQMRESAKSGRAQLFDYYTHEYRKRFEKVNTELAKEHYDDLVDRLITEGFDDQSALVQAAQMLWENRKYHPWLSSTIKMMATNQRPADFPLANEPHTQEELS